MNRTEIINAVIEDTLQTIELVGKITEVRNSIVTAKHPAGKEMLIFEDNFLFEELVLVAKETDSKLETIYAMDDPTIVDELLTATKIAIKGKEELLLMVVPTLEIGGMV